jgi:hypothetical protein
MLAGGFLAVKAVKRKGIAALKFMNNLRNSGVLQWPALVTIAVAVISVTLVILMALPWSLATRAKFALSRAPQWDITGVWRLNGDDFLVQEGFWGIGRFQRYCGRFIVVAGSNGEVKGQYIHNDQYSTCVGQMGPLLWLHTNNDGLHARD